MQKEMAKFLKKNLYLRNLQLDRNYWRDWLERFPPIRNNPRSQNSDAYSFAQLQVSVELTNLKGNS